MGRLAAIGRSTFALVVPVKHDSVPVFATLASEDAHSRLAGFVDQFSIAAYADEAAASGGPDSTGTLDTASVAGTGGDEARGDAAGSPAIVANAGWTAEAASSGFVDVVATPVLAGFEGTSPVSTSVPGLIDLSVYSR
jgi:hypothetical protein